jgi:dihydroorotase (multifunctional complex type)
LAIARNLTSSRAFDTVITGATLVSAKGRVRLNIGILGSQIAALTEEPLTGRAEIDADGLLAMPGMVDAHVHLMDPGDPTREDFPTGTGAAAAAGVTTIIEHTHARPVVTAADFDEKADYLTSRSRVDFALGAHAIPGRENESRGVWEAGAAFVKAFTCSTHGLEGFDAARLRTLFEHVAGAGGVCLLHCEDESLTADAEKTLHEAGREDPGIVPVWRSREAEVTATSLAALLARLTHVRAVIAHVSHLPIVDLIAEHRAAGADLTVESCPQYFTLMEKEVLDHGAFRKFTPPARARTTADQAALWAALADGRIDYISTDHAPATREQKLDGSIWDVHFGLPGLDTTFSVLLDAAASGHLSYERVVDVYAHSPARIYGLAPRKGSLAVGGDADIVLVDPELKWTVKDADIKSKAAWSPMSGRTLRGRAVRTYLRGRLVAADGRPTGEPGDGLLLRRGAQSQAKDLKQK